MWGFFQLAVLHVIGALVLHTSKLCNFYNEYSELLEYFSDGLNGH